MAIKENIEPGAGRILMISVMGIGNALLGLPLISALSRQRGAAVALAAWPPVTLKLLEGNPAIGQMVPVESNSVAGLIKASGKCREHKAEESYEIFPPSDRGHLLSFLSGAGRRRGFIKSGGQNWLLNSLLEVKAGLHDVEQNLRLAESPADGENRPRIYLSPEELDQAVIDLPQDGAVGFHIGSGGSLMARRWPAANFARLMDDLWAIGYKQMIMFGGPGQENLMQQCLSLCQTARPRIEASPDIRRAAALAGRCRLFISNDAVWMHIAAALEVPTLGIYGPTDPGRTKPYGRNSRVVKPDLKCVPCYSYERWKKCPRNYQCLENIRPQEVMVQALQMLDTSTVKER